MRYRDRKVVEREREPLPAVQIDYARFYPEEWAEKLGGRVVEDESIRICIGGVYFKDGDWIVDYPDDAGLHYTAEQFERWFVEVAE